MELKEKKNLYEILVKLSNIFNDFYITKNNFVISLDSEKPFLIELNEVTLKLFVQLCGEFKILRIFDLKNFKKALQQQIDSEKATKKEINQDKILDINNYYSLVEKESESKKVTNLLDIRMKEINNCKSWEPFVLSQDEEGNAKLIISLFKDNDYITFLPVGTDNSPELILTKSLLPLVSEKNYTNLYYSSQKIDDGLYVIIFDFQFTLFRLYMIHYYIDIK